MLALLEGLTYGEQSSPEAVRTRREWQAQLEQMWAARRRPGHAE